MRPGGALLGILGGMGPLATAAFLAQLVTLAEGVRDQDHHRTIVYSNPRIPDRSDAILGRGPSPLPCLLDGLALLERSGADAIAIPCNTAHYWLSDLLAVASVPIISIVDAVVTELRDRCRGEACVGILGTAGTLRSRTYHHGLSALGYEVLEPSDLIVEEAVEPAIRAIKAGHLGAAAEPLDIAVSSLEARGAQAIVLGCTEIPLVLSRAGSANGTPFIDSTRSLAKACLAWASARDVGSPRAEERLALSTG